jgi:hypothetical protein
MDIVKYNEIHLQWFCVTEETYPIVSFNIQTLINSDWFISLVKQTLKDQYNQIWHSQTENSAKALTYRLFKDNFMPEPYLDIVNSKNAII